MHSKTIGVDRTTEITEPTTSALHTLDATGTGLTLSMRLVLATVGTAEGFGIERGRLFELARFEPSRLERVDGRVSAQEFSRLCELVIELSADPALGLHEGEAMTGVGFDVVASVMVHALTLRQALVTLIQIHKLLHDQRRYELAEQADVAVLCCASLLGVSESVRRFIAEVELTGFCRMLRFFRADARPQRVCFEHAAPDYRLEYTRVFEGREQFGQPFTGLQFDRALLDKRSLFGDPAMFGALVVHAQERLSRLVRGTGYAQRVSEVLANATLSRFDMATVAHALGLSVRSLRRRLASEHTSFQAVANRALANVARRLLLIERRTIQETAHKMGYADSGAFHRAFKRWTGMTPTEFLAER